MIELPLRGNGMYSVPTELVQKLEEFYGPGIYVEFQKAALWLLTNPRKRKTVRGTPKFLNTWMSRAKMPPKQVGIYRGPGAITDEEANNWRRKNGMVEL